MVDKTKSSAFFCRANCVCAVCRRRHWLGMRGCRLWPCRFIGEVSHVNTVDNTCVTTAYCMALHSKRCDCFLLHYNVQHTCMLACMQVYTHVCMLLTDNVIKGALHFITSVCNLCLSNMYITILCSILVYKQ